MELFSHEVFLKAYLNKKEKQRMCKAKTHCNLIRHTKLR